MLKGMGKIFCLSPLERVLRVKWSGVIGFYTPFKIPSLISRWLSPQMVEETIVPGETQLPWANKLTKGLLTFVKLRSVHVRFKPKIIIFVSINLCYRMDNLMMPMLILLDKLIFCHSMCINDTSAFDRKGFKFYSFIS